VAKLELREYKYYKEDIDQYNPINLKKWIEELENKTPKTVSELEEFINKVDELCSKMSDIGSELYIKMTCDISDTKIRDDYTYFEENIVAYYSPKDFNFKKIISESPAFDEWAKTHGETGVLFKSLLIKDKEMFREENVPLHTKESSLGVEYRSIIGSTIINFNGEEKTLPEMEVFLEDSDRQVRESAWRASNNKILEHKETLNKLFDKLYDLRINIAKNAGFSNYRDYVHKEKGRFSYTVSDIYNFHDAVESEMLPLIKSLNKKRCEKLKIETLKPWDTKVSLDGIILKPVEKLEELIPKTIKIMEKTDIEFGRDFSSMNDTNLLDLFGRKNKAPGAYSQELYKYGASFIFMNAVGTQSDLNTLAHEIGHACHEFAQKTNKYTSFLELPMEAAELASMAMEMISMPHWRECYQEETIYNKVRLDHIENALKFFPWCMTVDSFQHKIYTDSPDAVSRETAFTEIMTRYSDAVGVDWTGLDKEKGTRWMRQLHIFEMPFYYIEYGIAQLGALAVYREYKKDAKKAVENYKRFLAKGYQVPLAKLYKEAGIELKFTKEYIRDLVSFIKDEIL